MGTVLEMTGGRARLGLALAAAAVALSGCELLLDASAPPGSRAAPAPVEGVLGGLRSLRDVRDTVLSGIGSGDGEDEDAPPAPRAAPDFSPAAITSEPDAFRLIQINALGLQEPSRIIRRNGEEITVQLQSGPTAAFDGGVLVATRGFGDDLFTLSSRGVPEALRAGGGQVVRHMETLDSRDQIRTTRFECAFASPGSEVVDLGLRQVSLRRVDEHCRSEALIFDNIYWLDGSGRILSSRQFVSPTVAYLRSNVL